MTEYGTLLTAYILAVFIIIVKKKKKMKRQILHRNKKDALHSVQNACQERDITRIVK